ncbi:MAG: pyridoxamine 5'-phosphate oxidase family protein, partial [Methylotenera sp.]|nr:pyridoxamine 5'-phosphate oxidase family protein [Flavobacterium sp.]
MTQIEIAALRENYTKGSLDVEDASSSPIEQFQIWFDEAVSSQLLEPNALLLSTVSNQGKPSARIVLLKGLDNGF